jgi:endonuclease/exonuclease/phosphatase (EEP) superfamily protein YafD
VPLVAFLALVVSLASVAAFLGGTLPLLDLVANFRPHLVVTALVLSLILGLGRWRKWAVMAAGFALLNLGVVVPLFIGPGSRPERTDLRVMSFNLLSSNDRYDEVIGYIEQEAPDLVILHEASLPWEQALERAGLDYEITRGRSDDLIFGSLVLAPAGSRVESFGFAVYNPRAIEVLLPSGVAVLGIHPLAPFPEVEAERRAFQFEFASLWALAQTGPRIVVGDFNAGPWSYHFRRLRAVTGLENSQAGYGLELSFPAQANPLLQVSIDHLLHSGDLAVVDRRLGPPLGSDHLPLLVDLSIEGSPSSG